MTTWMKRVVWCVARSSLQARPSPVKAVSRGGGLLPRPPWKRCSAASSPAITYFIRGNEMLVPSRPSVDRTGMIVVSL
ncbi:hypothetical protein BC827DRAFT_527991 [Russula dissimulans]|nr:hypothetical protein BC827DRAFT_527991 [Russula dissimulans]